MFSACGVPTEKVRTISSAVDKLDKMPWSDVRKEMVDEKGLDAEVAERIGEYVKLKGGKELCELLEKDARLKENAVAMEGIKEMKTLFGFLEVFGVEHKVCLEILLIPPNIRYQKLHPNRSLSTSPSPAVSTTTPA